jgi:glycerol-3-phosphate dehydrogenase
MATEKKQVAIIGAGVAGLGVALALLEKGVAVTVYDSGLCGAGTSSASLRIMHGGFRYLQSLDLARVVYSLKAKIELQRRYPEYIRELVSFMGLSGKKLERAPLVACGALGYGLLQRLLGDTHQVPRVLSKVAFERKFAEVVPYVHHQQGVLSWSDGAIEDHHSFVKKLCIEITQNGGEIFEQKKVLSLKRTNSTTIVTTEKEEREFDWAVDTTGEKIFTQSSVAKTLGFNLILKRKVNDEYGVGFRSRTGRLFFVVPRGAISVLGTGYVPNATPLFKGAAAVDEFLKDAAHTNPALKLSMEDVGSVEVGVLPASSEQGDASSLTERTTCTHPTRGVTEYALTKYTTFLADGRGVANYIMAEMK